MLIFVTLPLLFVAIAFACVRHMHFFQLNSYKFAEHKVWMRRNKSSLAILAIFSLLPLAALLFQLHGAIIYLSTAFLIYALLAKPKSRKASKKPLVYTPRVNRMLFTEAVIFILPAVLICLFAPFYYIPIYAAAALLLAPHACLVANVINAPVEKAIRDGFTKEAVSMLRSHPNLRVVGITGSYGKTSTKYYLSTILSEKFTAAYARRIINVHPSLIPAFCGKGFYGLKVHEAALAYGLKVTGATVHFVNEIPDGGEIILQKAVEILEGDTPEVLQRRVMEEAEWLLLPAAVEKVASDLSEKGE